MSREDRGCAGAAVGPPGEPPLGKPFVAKPKPLTVIDQDLQCRGPTVAEDKHPAAQRIVLQRFPTESRQAVNPAAEIGRLAGHDDSHLRGNLDHGWQLHRLRPSVATSGASMPFNQIRSFLPPAFSNSTAHSQDAADTGGASSRKVATIP